MTKKTANKIEKQIEPAAIWSSRLIVFDKGISNTQNIILSQGQDALTAMLCKIEQLYERLQYMPNFRGICLHPEIAHILSEICFHQGLASTILFNESKRGKQESDYAYKLRLERFNYVKHFCKSQSIQVSILSNKKLRHQIVHIDEYLANALCQPNKGWLIDVAVDSRNQFKVPSGIELCFCRTFIASEEIIIHLDSEVSVKKLWEEANDVLSAVFKVPPRNKPNQNFNAKSIYDSPKQPVKFSYTIG